MAANGGPAVVLSVGGSQDGPPLRHGLAVDCGRITVKAEVSTLSYSVAVSGVAFVLLV